MRHTHAIRSAARVILLALVVSTALAVPLLAQTPAQHFPDLVGALKSTPGCLGVEAGSMASGKQVIFAWFENKKAVLNWFYSNVHQGAMRAFAPKASTGRPPLAQVADETGPILAIASITLADAPQVDGVQLPVSQIAIELYTPLPGGAALGGRFAPSTVTVPGLLEAPTGRTQSTHTDARASRTAPSAAARALTIRVTGLNAANAPLRIAVFNSELAWLDEASAVYKTILDGNTREREWRIANVPEGEYAVAVFHDENSDGRLNRNRLGVPLEQYGFSNNRRGAFGPASWKDSSFAVTSERTGISIEVR